MQYSHLRDPVWRALAHVVVQQLQRSQFHVGREGNRDERLRDSRVSGVRHPHRVGVAVDRVLARETVEPSVGGASGILKFGQLSL